MSTTSGRSDLQRVAGRVAVVTGAAGAIGRTYARALAEAGYRLVLADLRDVSGLAEQLDPGGTQVVATGLDVVEAGSARAMAELALGRFGRIDVLVNNAAYLSEIEKCPAEEISLESWDRAFAVNVRGSWLCTCAVLPAMKAQRSGKVVNTSSTSWHAGTPGFAHYVASKAAIVGLTRCLARELGDFGIQVNAITPDYIAHDGALFASQPGLEAELAAQRCLRRPGTAEDLVGALLFLAGDHSSFVTGQELIVDGGRLWH